ncbi:unnamed protein product [Nyctereutes procyonoides]|uniref:(raccoon dog) hypothetical protein n=1 Tax=Nyctereutes procyonoides TaxID=34880 RepID=A0A811ZBF2_NYCPR|nr:unnamed protein product [Nyctereutes procyonoides]
MVTPKKMKMLLELINSKLQFIMKSGKCWAAWRRTLKMIRHDKVKLVIFVNNCPALRKCEIEYYTMFAKHGNNIKLGKHVVNTIEYVHGLSLDTGDSVIIRSTPEQTSEK